MTRLNDAPKQSSGAGKFVRGNLRDEACAAREEQGEGERKETGLKENPSRPSASSVCGSV